MPGTGSSPDVGIDDLNLYAGGLAVECAEIARARGFGERDLAATGFVRRSVVPPFEDPVTLAVNAARPLVEAAGAGAFGLLIVGTETGLDYAKPISSYVHRYLGLEPSCRNFEVKHACYAATAAVRLAADWAGAGATAGKKALVIATDLAGSAGRRAHHPSELTSGEGAVALSVSAAPRILALEASSGCAARETHDVARPHPTIEVADPLLSLSSYLDLLEIAWEGYRKMAGPLDLEAHFRYLVCHAPFCWLVRQAHRLLVETGVEEIDDAEVTASFERMVAPTLVHTRELGNIYSGSLYAGLAGLLGGLPPTAAGARVGLYSYGSGACAEFFAGVIAAEGPARVAARRIGAHLAARRPVTVTDYEAAATAIETSLTAADFTPDRSRPAWRYDADYRGRGLLVLESVAVHRRSYTWS